MLVVTYSIKALLQPDVNDNTATQNTLINTMCTFFWNLSASKIKSHSHNHDRKRFSNNIKVMNLNCRKSLSFSFFFFFFFLISNNNSVSPPLLPSYSFCIHKRGAWFPKLATSKNSNLDQWHWKTDVDIFRVLLFSRSFSQLFLSFRSR